MTQSESGVTTFSSDELEMRKNIPFEFFIFRFFFLFFFLMCYVVTCADNAEPHNRPLMEHYDLGLLLWPNKSVHVGCILV